MNRRRVGCRGMGSFVFLSVRSWSAAFVSLLIIISIAAPKIASGQDHPFFSMPKDSSTFALRDSLLVFSLDHGTIGYATWYVGLAKVSSPDTLIAWRFLLNSTVVGSLYVGKSQSRSFDDNPLLGCLVIHDELAREAMEETAKEGFYVVFGNQMAGNGEEFVQNTDRMSGVPSVVLDNVEDTIRITIDADPPTIDSIDVAPKCRRAGDTYFVSAGSFTITWLARDATSGIYGSWIDLDGKRIDGTLRNGSDGVWTCTLDSLQPGVHSLSIVAMDYALAPSLGESEWTNIVGRGNVSRDTIRVVVGDVGRPTLDIDTPELVNRPWSVEISASDSGCGLKSISLEWALNDTTTWQSLWDTTLTCSTGFSDSLLFTPSAGPGLYIFRVIAWDCAGNDTMLYDSTRYTPTPGIAIFAVYDTTSIGDGEHRASLGFVNEPVALDTLCLVDAPRDDSTYVEYALEPLFQNPYVSSWSQPLRGCEVDTIPLGVNEDGRYTIYARVIRPTLGDTVGPAEYSLTVDTKLPNGEVVVTNHNDGACLADTLWTNGPVIRIAWKRLNDSHLRSFQPRMDTTLSIPNNVKEGWHRLTEFFRLVADDSAGNVLRPDTLFCYDHTTPDSSLVDFYVRRDSVNAIWAYLKFRRDWSADDWAARGIKFVKFVSGALDSIPCDSFKSNTNRHAVPVASIREGSELRWPFEGPIPSDGWFTAAFLDSAGSISETFHAYLSPLKLSIAYLYDPTPLRCQDSTHWSNDRDSIGVCIDMARSTWGRFDRLRVKYSWGDSIDLALPAGPCFKVPIVSPPSECLPQWITVIAYDDSSGGYSADSASIVFDFTPPSIANGLIGVQELKSCGAVTGWASHLTLRVVKDSSRFSESCAGGLLAVRPSGDVVDSLWKCWNDFDSLRICGPADSSGVREIGFVAADSAGNESSGEAKLTVFFDVDGADTSVLYVRLVDRDSSCYSFPVISGDSGKVCFRLKGKWNESDWRLRGMRDYVVLEGKYDSPLRCEDYIGSNPKDFPDGFWTGQYVTHTLRFGSHQPGDSIFVSVFVRDSSGVISTPLMGRAVYVPQPSLVIGVLDPLDPTDSLFVGTDSIRVTYAWSNVPPDDSVRVVIVHPARNGCATDTLVDSFAVGPGRAEKDTTICVSARGTYNDTLFGKLVDMMSGQSDVDSAVFIVDLLPPSLRMACAVQQPGTRACNQEVQSSRIWVYADARDIPPGSLNVACVRARQMKTGDTLQTSCRPFEPNSNETWVPLTLPSEEPGWWQLHLWVEDKGGHRSDSTITVDYVPSGSGAFCYPNPFRPADGQVLCFSVRSEAAGKAKVEIWDTFGNLVRRWTTGMLHQGRNDGCDGAEGLLWDGQNGKGEPVGSGAYLGRILTPDGREHRIKIGVVR